ncbi:MAG: VOC family protein [Bryobacteraceae bacterium]
MTRRHLLAVMGAAAAQRASAQTALKFRGLDHIEFTVTDVEKSTNFYAQLFGGADVMKNRTTTRRYIKLGASYMAIDRADAPKIDHVCLGVENFNIDEVHAYLTAQGLTYRDYPSGRDTGVNDPDGTRMQLSSPDGWTSLAAQTASPESRTLKEPAIFQPVALIYAQVGVVNLPQATAHYEKLVGPSQNPTKFNVGQGFIDLQQGAPGFRRFTVRVRSFDEAQVIRRLEALGARMEKPERRAQTVQFLDLDGFRVEVIYPQ